MEVDRFLQNFDSSDLRIAEDFLITWLPFLTRDLCEGCAAVLHNRIGLLNSGDERNPGIPETEEFEGDLKGSEMCSGEEASDSASNVKGHCRASLNGHEHMEATGGDAGLAPESPKIEGSVEGAEVGSGDVQECLSASPKGYRHIEAPGWDTDPAQELPKVEGDVEGSKEGSRDGDLDIGINVEGYSGASEVTVWDKDPAQVSFKVKGDVEGSKVGNGEGDLRSAGNVEGYFSVSLNSYEHIEATGWDIDPTQDFPKVEGDVDGSKFVSGKGHLDVVCNVKPNFGASFMGYEHIQSTGWDVEPAQDSFNAKGDVDGPEVSNGECVVDVAGNVGGYFIPSMNCYEHIQATGWDVEPAQDSFNAEDVDGHEVSNGECVAGNVGGFFSPSMNCYEHIQATGWDVEPAQDSFNAEGDVDGPEVSNGECVADVVGNVGGYFSPTMNCYEHIEATGWDTNSPQDSPKVNGYVHRSEVRGGEGNSGVTGYVKGYYGASPNDYEHIVATGWDEDPSQESAKVRLSWADMTQEDESEEKEEADVRWKNRKDGMGKDEVELKRTELSTEQNESARFTNLGRKKDFVCLERIDGKIVNILDGLELYTGVFSVAEQKRIVDFVYELQKQGRNNELGEDTYLEHKRWMPGKGHVTMQFGCCYNYVEKNGISEGILRDVVADPIPNLFKDMIKRLVRWRVMPASCVPDSCVVNICEPGVYISPHIDSHDFVRPFCTTSFLSERDVVFGSNLQSVDGGEFAGSTALPLPLGSVLVFKGKAADVAKHCIPAVPSKRIFITFRKMDEKKRPFGFRHDSDLSNIRPYDSRPRSGSQIECDDEEPFVTVSTMRGRRSNGRSNGGKGRWDSNKSESSASDQMWKKPFYASRDSMERSRRGLMDDDDDDKVSAGRRVRVEQRRVVVTRYLDRERDSMASRGSSARHQLCKQRRGQMNM